MITTLISAVNNKIFYGYDISHKQWKIKEEDPSARRKVNTVLIEVSDGESMCIKLDSKKLGKPCKYLNLKSRGYTSGCDAVILHRIADDLFVSYIELKSDKYKNIDIENKFKASRAFMRYLFAIAKEFFEMDIKPKAEYYILFSSREMKVAMTNPRKQPYIDLTSEIRVKKFGAMKYPNKTMKNISKFYT
ncbi:MAG: hypothetical protein HQK56_07760 [Deltaproteobacteria bacterium]|nr:hypothetical protein [Deltaproteobacteria bacterium]